MNADEYQGKALRTMAPQQTILDRLVKLGTKAVQADNAQRGLMDEVGELAAVQKKWVEYGGPEPDPVNILEEAGDVVWRVTQLLDAYGLKLEDALAFNIAKLAKRYPDAYSDHLAQEENRDRTDEYEALKGGVSVLDVQNADRELEKLREFKAYVHTRLDQMGVPHHPPGPHGAKGCRIGDRLDWVDKRMLVPPTSFVGDKDAEKSDKEGVVILVLDSTPEHRHYPGPEPQKDEYFEASGRVRCRVRQDGNIVLPAGAPSFLNSAGAEELAACLVAAAKFSREKHPAPTGVEALMRGAPGMPPAEQDGHGFAHGAGVVR